MPRRKLIDDPRAVAFGSDFGAPLWLDRLRFPFSDRVRFGDKLLRWADANAELVQIQRIQATAAGQAPQAGTLALLAAAEQARANLAAQAGGAAPTLRAVYYRLVALYALEKSDETYGALGNATKEARYRGAWSRFSLSDKSMPSMDTPESFGVLDALRWALDTVARPDDAFVDCGVVVGVVCEAGGMETPLRGALRQRFGFPVPVWATGGQASIPFQAHTERAINRWAEARDADAHLFVITDFDPSGLVIANAIERHVAAEIHRVGVTPSIAERYGAPTAEGLTIRKDKPENTHEASLLWQDSMAQHGDVKVQAEALGYADWAQVIGEAIDGLLTDSGRSESCDDLSSALDERREDFERGDRLLGLVRDRFSEVEDADDPIAELADLLGLPWSEP